MNFSLPGHLMLDRKKISHYTIKIPKKFPLLTSIESHAIFIFCCFHQDYHFQCVIRFSCTIRHSSFAVRRSLIHYRLVVRYADCVFASVTRNFRKILVDCVIVPAIEINFFSFRVCVCAHPSHTDKQKQAIHLYEAGV